MQSTQIVLRQRPVGAPNAETFEVRTSELPDIQDGEVLLAIRYLSLDPYMRGRLSTAKSYAAPVEIGQVMVGATVGQVLATRHERLHEGDWVVSYSGWQTHAAEHGDMVRKLDPSIAPVTTALGVLGMPGMTAYWGLLEIGRPQPGETVVVAAATGPVGSAVGQIARIKGARAVGIAGGPEKCRLLVDTFGFDAAVDHRAPDFVDQLVAATPDGIDVNFENVGGSVFDAVQRRLNPGARVPLCGLVSHYNDTAMPQGPDRLPGFLSGLLTRSILVQGFIVDITKVSRATNFWTDMPAWIRDGGVTYLEDIVSGIEQAPEAFSGLLQGANTGKLIVQVS